MKIIAITGGSGNMGSEVVKQLAETGLYKCRILLREKKHNIKLAKKLIKKYGNKIEILLGDLTEYEDCRKLIDGADYLIHCGALIPPYSDHHPEETVASNYGGTKNLVKAALNSLNKDNLKFVNIGTVAEYGNRTFKHAWGRVGDPLMPSNFDIYAASKTKAEREVIESGLNYWVSLRQSGVLYDKVLMKNMNDGLMFHTPWNCPIEWATARSSGLMIKNLVNFTENGSLPENFWRKVYNIGNGEKARVTGYETLDRGFKLMGRGVRDIFEPHWNVKRNFHCMWFYDSKVLDDYLHFQNEGFEDFFTKLEKKYWYFKLGKPFPRLIKQFTIKPLLKNTNAPVFWANKGLTLRLTAFYGKDGAYEKTPHKWEEFHLLCENINPETGESLDYAKLKDINTVNPEKDLLKHGYDESKADFELDIKDMKQAALFRGGECVSKSMQKGEMYTPLEWKCHNGHTFTATPYLVLKTGHWCPHCCTAPPWNFNVLAKHIPFYAQLHNDDHAETEIDTYEADCYKDILKFE